tara:strand:- start:6725 stop:6946 length:222 start_codon:yes stop_codon:yes gene_type:complete
MKKILSNKKIKELKKGFYTEEITLYKSDFERKYGIEFEYILNDLFGHKISQEELEKIEDITLEVSAIKNISRQ